MSRGLGDVYKRQIHGHPGGSKSGAMAMRQAIDRNYGVEYEQAIQKWGLVK